MADSLVLTGSRQVTKHTGTEMVRTDAKRGGNTWQLPRWWVQGNGTVYVDCTVFKVDAGGASGYLAIESNPSVNMRIEHDGAFNFAFYGNNEATRAALYDSSMAIVEHYVFPRISGGKVMTVTPVGAATRPSAGPPATSIGTATATGSGTASDGDSSDYSVSINGDAGNLTYQWTVTGDAAITAGATSATATVEFTFSGGSAGVTCVVTSADANVSDSPKTSNTVSVTVSA